MSYQLLMWVYISGDTLYLSIEIENANGIMTSCFKPQCSKTFSHVYKCMDNVTFVCVHNVCMKHTSNQVSLILFIEQVNHRQDRNKIRNFLKKFGIYRLIELVLILVIMCSYLSFLGI